jgi:hypothetical protein
MAEGCLQRENVHPSSDCVGCMGVTELVRMQVDIHRLAPAAHPISNGLVA